MGGTPKCPVLFPEPSRRAGQGEFADDKENVRLIAVHLFTGPRYARDDATTFGARLNNLHQDIAAREDTAGDIFTIVLDRGTVANRGLADEFRICRTGKLKNQVCEEVLSAGLPGLTFVFSQTSAGMRTVSQSAGDQLCPDGGSRV
jgi:hypothetical protein